MQYCAVLCNTHSGYYILLIQISGQVFCFNSKKQKWELQMYEIPVLKYMNTCSNQICLVLTGVQNLKSLSCVNILFLQFHHYFSETFQACFQIFDNICSQLFRIG